MLRARYSFGFQKFSGIQNRQIFVLQNIGEHHEDDSNKNKQIKNNSRL